ncbi:MAG: oligosaccharide flippase family protein [Hydrogenothermaceae bacterium]|nr:oligosaccharide flippase family protein [Hydrogenothermaceae bacterium]
MYRLRINTDIRSINYKRQVLYSFIFKGFALALSLLSLPLMIKYLGVERYGVWSTILSILSWIVFFDLGIGNGLKNKISEYMAKNDFLKVKKYISNAYVMATLISLVVLSLFLFLNAFLNWQKIFNTTSIPNKELYFAINISAFFIFLNFIFGLINQIFSGLQKTSVAVFSQFLINLLILICLWILYSFFSPSLVLISIFYGFSILFSTILISVYFYTKNKQFIPSFRFFDTNYIKSLISLSYKFFIIQVAVLVIFTTDKILITQLFGPEYVTAYDVVYKLFSVITVFYGIISTPLWPAYSSAYHKGDFKWIRNTMKKQFKFYFFILIVVFILTVSSREIINIWVGNISLDYKITISIAIFVLVSVWNNIFAMFINAIDKLDIQLYTSLFGIFLNIPLSFFFVKFFNTGVEGIIIASILSLSLFSIAGPIQSFLILTKRGGSL